jgi:hypothetical protein
LHSSSHRRGRRRRRRRRKGLISDLAICVTCFAVCQRQPWISRCGFQR